MEAPLLFTRQNFIKTFIVSAAHSSLWSRHWTSALASEISPLSATAGTLRLRLQNFPALQNDLGSVRIAINPINGNSGPNGTFYPVIINRAPNNTFFAVSSRCTHQGCVVEALDPSSLQMNCFCHGSVYAIDGRRISGLASSALAKYTVAFDGTDLLNVTVPGLAYSLNVASVASPTPGSQRLQLSFRSFRNVEYEVQYRKALDAAPEAVPFATTAAGSADQTAFTAPSATNTNFFVDSNSPAGFYTVAIRLSEV